MKRYNILQPLLLAFYSKSLYRDIGQNWRGRGFVYLWLLAFILTILFSFNFLRVENLALKFADAMTAQLPIITINNGITTIDQPEPYFIKSPGNSSRVLAIIDSTGEYTSLTNTTALALLTKNQLIVQWSGDKIKEYDLSNTNKVYHPNEIKQALHVLIYWLGVAVCLLIWPLYFLLCVLITLFFSGLTKLLIHTGLTYKTTCRLAAVALTPATALMVVLTILANYLPEIKAFALSYYRWFIYVGLSFGYLLYGMQANWEIEQK
jgi:hypothetical protein